MMTRLFLLHLCNWTHPHPASIGTDAQPISGFEECYYVNQNDLQEQPVLVPTGINEIISLAFNGIKLDLYWMLEHSYNSKQLNLMRNTVFQV